MRLSCYQRINYWYIIVGQGELKEELKQLDKTGRLKLLGYRTDIVELLRCSDLFVFPSLQEGLPVALMEAMSCGVPCIASRIRGNVDLVTDIDHLFEPTNTTEVLKQITLQHKYKSDDNPYNSSEHSSEYISHNSEQNHIQDYSLKNVTTVMLDIYPSRLSENSSNLLKSEVKTQGDSLENSFEGGVLVVLIFLTIFQEVVFGQPAPEIIRMLVRIIIREEIDIPQDAFLLVSVGEFNKNKNHSVIIKALALLKDSKDGKDSTIGAVHYAIDAIAGRGNLDLNAVAIEYGVEKQVHLLGYRSDIPALYMAAHVCVFPSIREGLG